MPDPEGFYRPAPSAGSAIKRLSVDYADFMMPSSRRHSLVRVETIQGVVHLRGYAVTEQHRQRAGKIAESVAGVKQVDNDIRVR